MNYLPTMTEDEIKYVCSVIPLPESVGYFKRYPKDFAKIMPGFRATNLKNHQQVSAVLFKSRNQPFISSFIENHINRWLHEIQSEITKITDKGESKESAWIHTLPFCFFVDNIGIFFKLVGEEYSEEYISLLSQSIRRIKDLENSSKKLKAAFTDNESEQECLKDEIKRVQMDLEKSSKKLIEHSAEINALKRINADLEKSEGVVLSREQEIVTLKKELQKRDKFIQSLKDELSSLKDEQRQLEKKIREQIEKQQIAKLIEQAVSSKPRCPKDKEEFRDYLGYNFENLGIVSNAEYYSLLKDYLCEILFTGKPILVSRNTGVAIMRCIGNTLVGSANVGTLIFKSDISEQKIDEFLSAKNRILCLYNFIGNFNETILTTICDKHRDKIIFLTIAYDRTLRYVPEEFLKYCHYLNLNRIEAFTNDHALTEDPSSVDEAEASGSVTTPNDRWATFLKEMLDEIGVSSALSTYKSLLISDEEKLCQLLAFDILPFCKDVLEIHPFSVSERLNKYAGDNGRCSYKELFRRWFS